MARVGLKDTWNVRGSLAEVLPKIHAFLRQHGMKVAEEFEDELHAKQGSQWKTRLLGGWFVSAKSLPKLAIIRFKEDEEGVRINAVIEESLGFGFLDSVLKDKYLGYFETWLDDFRDAVQ